MVTAFAGRKYILDTSRLFMNLLCWFPDPESPRVHTG